MIEPHVVITDALKQILASVGARILEAAVAWNPDDGGLFCGEGWYMRAKIDFGKDRSAYFAGLSKTGPVVDLGKVLRASGAEQFKYYMKGDSRFTKTEVAAWCRAFDVWMSNDEIEAAK